MTRSEHIVLHRTGTHHSEETKKKMSEAAKGKPKSKEHRAHMCHSKKSLEEKLKTIESLKADLEKENARHKRRVKEIKDKIFYYSA